MQEKGFVISLPLRISELTQVLVFGVISILSFFVPFSLGHPQWLVGTAVNACLFLAAMFLPERYFVPMAILPSLGVLSRGLIFGPFTMFLVYFLPFIWLGNLILILLFKLIYSKVLKNFGIAAVGGAAGKFVLLFLMANIYFKFSIVPAVFLQAMEFNQIATALAGGLLAFIVLYAYRKRHS